MTLINGTAYSWGQIEIIIGGQTITSATAVKYSEEQDMQLNYGVGNRPVSRGFGNFKTDGSITLSMVEIEALQAASPNGNIQELPDFDVIIAYVPMGGIGTTQHALRNCRFANNGRDVKQGDMNIETELKLSIAKIDWRA